MRFTCVPLLVFGLGCGGTQLPTATSDAGTPDAASIVDAVLALTPDAGVSSDTAPAKSPVDAGEKPGSGGALDASKGGAIEMEPGTPAKNPAALGQGPCAGKTLAEVIAAVHQQQPALADIRVLSGADPNLGGDGNLIFAFAHGGGFRLVFKRGAGDCPAGCIDNRYAYFETSGACVPAQVGGYSRIYTSPGNCFTVEGNALWGIPAAIDPMYVCGADNRPQNINGTYKLRGTGNRTACTEKRGDEPTEKVGLELSVTLAQDPADLSRGAVTVLGTGNPRIDAVTVPATFSRRRVTATRAIKGATGLCLDEQTLTVELDLEGGTAGKLTFFEVRALGCPPSTDYCKGALTLELTGSK